MCAQPTVLKPQNIRFTMTKGQWNKKNSQMNSVDLGLKRKWPSFDHQILLMNSFSWNTCVYSCKAQFTPSLILIVVHQLCVDQTLSVGCIWCRPITVSGSWWQLLHITGGAKEMTSCPSRAGKRSPDRTVMTKDFLGNIRVHRGQKKSLGAVFS